MPKVSVLMPVYNTREEHLRAAIESILSQTFTDFEFIIVNDGSTNNAEEVIKSYKDKRIVYHKQENKGLSKTRNILLSVAKGEYLAFMDSDDISLPERLQKQVDILDNNMQIGAVGGWMEVFQNKSGIWKFREKPKLLDFYFYGNLFSQPLAMLRKSFFDQNNLRYNEDYPPAEDYELWSRAVRYMDFYNIQEVLLKYRWHGENVSITKAQLQKHLAQKIQDNILDYVCGTEELKNKIRFMYADLSQSENLLQKIFSIRNVRVGEKKFKKITLCGITFIWRK